MSKSVLNGTKIMILKEIRDKKVILFGSFSDKLTKKDKIECWKTVHQKSTSLGLVPPNKDWTYSRDVFWQNLKKTTMKKVDNRRKTGSGGGTDSKFTEMDNVVLDILGPDNPILCSLGISETWEQDPEKEQDPENVEQEIENSNHLQDHGATNKIKNTNVFISTGSSSVPTASYSIQKSWVELLHRESP
uniref:Regulatory protein zeste n=1 Tax=Diabrotica virgifera virgifera TaxID=50390 RepID=A0A6P7FFP7_DIAVI